LLFIKKHLNAFDTLKANLDDEKTQSSLNKFLDLLSKINPPSTGEDLAELSQDPNTKVAIQAFDEFQSDLTRIASQYASFFS